MLSRDFRIAILMLACSVLSHASSITGTVTNLTRQQLSGGDDIILLKLTEGLPEVAHAKTDSHGRFILEIPDDGAKHLIRAVHQGVYYHHPIPKNAAPVEIRVYDATESVDGLTVRSDVVKVQAASREMSITELFNIKNNSIPPRTHLSEHGMEFTLPEGANVVLALAAGSGGMPSPVRLIPAGRNGHYACVFPIRPGETRLQILYHLAYTGSYSFRKTMTMPMEHFVVALPKAMRFRAPKGSSFQSQPNDFGMNLYVTSSLDTGQKIAFDVSGTGQAASAVASWPNRDPATSSSVQAEASSNRQALIPTNIAISKNHKWSLRIGLALAAVASGFLFFGLRARRRRTLAMATAQLLWKNAPSPEVGSSSGVAPGDIKEALFQLEIEWVRGRISREEYERTQDAVWHAAKSADFHVPVREA